MSQLKQAAQAEALMKIAGLREKMNLLFKDLFWTDRAETKTWLLSLTSNSKETCDELRKLGLQWSEQQLQMSLYFVKELESKNLHLLQWRDFAILLFFYFETSARVEPLCKKLIQLDEMSRKCWLCPEEFNSIHAEKVALFVDQIEKGFAHQHPLFEQKQVLSGAGLAKSLR
jgi:hypothetical protein